MSSHSLETKSPTPRHWQGRVPPEGSRKECAPGTSSFWGVASHPGRSSASRHITWISASVTAPCSSYVLYISAPTFPSSYEDTVIKWGLTLIQHHFLLTSLHLQGLCPTTPGQPHFQIRSHSQLPGIRTWTYLLEGTQLNPWHLQFPKLVHSWFPPVWNPVEAKVTDPSAALANIWMTIGSKSLGNAKCHKCRWFKEGKGRKPGCSVELENAGATISQSPGEDHFLIPSGTQKSDGSSWL